MCLNCLAIYLTISTQVSILKSLALVAMERICSSYYNVVNVPNYIPINSSAASITAAPFSMVAMRISWPGQSTNDTCLQ